jgi:hypothetical protein
MNTTAICHTYTDMILKLGAVNLYQPLLSVTLTSETILTSFMVKTPIQPLIIQTSSASPLLLVLQIGNFTSNERVKQQQIFSLGRH